MSILWVDRGIKRREAYKLMTAVQVSLELGDVPHGAQTSKKALLALAEVPKKLRKQTFKDAAKKAKGTPTEKDIIEVSAEATNNFVSTPSGITEESPMNPPAFASACSLLAVAAVSEALSLSVAGSGAAVIAAWLVVLTALVVCG